MKKRGLKVQPVAYTGLFNACANSPWPATDGLQRATHLREELTGKGYKVNQIISHAMIKGTYRLGRCVAVFVCVCLSIHARSRFLEASRKSESRKSD